jgi:biotin carboxyl carrier protein
MRMRVTVEGTAYEVEVEMLDEPAAPPAATPLPPLQLSAPVWPAPRPGALRSDEKTCRSPIAGIVTRVLVEVGRAVKENDPLVVIEAMKMESNIASPAAGVVKSVAVEPGNGVKVGQTLVEFE